MNFKYPGQLKCPNCKVDIRLDPDKQRLMSDDLLIVGISVPLSYNLNDFTTNNQNLGRRRVYLCVCVQCGTVLGSDISESISF